MCVSDPPSSLLNTRDSLFFKIKLNQVTSFQQSSFKHCRRWHQQQMRNWSLDYSQKMFLNWALQRGSLKSWLKYLLPSKELSPCCSWVLSTRKSLELKNPLQLLRWDTRHTNWICTRMFLISSLVIFGQWNLLLLNNQETQNLMMSLKHMF